MLIKPRDEIRQAQQSKRAWASGVDVTCGGVVVVPLAWEPAIFDDPAFRVLNRKMRREADTLPWKSRISFVAS